MSSACRFLLSISPFISSSPLVSAEPICLYKGRNIEVQVPERPLANGSILVVPQNSTPSTLGEMYDTLQRIAQVWKANGISNYMIYSKTTEHGFSGWEIVPYQDTSFRFLAQLKVLWNVAFGGFKVGASEIERDKKLFSDSAIFTEEYTPLAPTGADTRDAFCNPAVIAPQLIYSGNEVDLLFNYAPIGIGKERLHFLLVPKKHRENFSQLTKSEYIEARQIANKLADFYKTKNISTVYMFDKTGPLAGQTVPHWHQHLIFTATKTQEFVGKLTVLKNMIFGSSAMKSEALTQRVAELRTELQDKL